MTQPFTNFSTLAEAFMRKVEGEDRPAALMVKRGGRYDNIAVSEVKSAVFSLAAGLLALRVKKGDAVALIAENRPEWLYADYAMMLIGAVNVPIYPTLTPPYIEFILNDCATTLVIVSNDAQYQKIQQIRAQLKKTVRVVLFEAPAGTPADGDMTLMELLRRGIEAGAEGEKQVRAAAAAVTPGDLASLIYTSGTTGQPKGVMLTHDNFCQNIINSISVVNLAGLDTALSLLPLCHSFQRVVDYICFTQGTAIAYAESVEKVKDNLLEVRPTVMAGVPRLYEKVFNGFVEKANAKALGRMLIGPAVKTARAVAAARLIPGTPPVSLWTKFQHKIFDRLLYSKLRGNLGGNIRFFISGGAALAKDHALFFHGVGLPIVEGYGLSETSPVITLSPLEAIRPGSPGKPIPTVEVTLAADGEILTRSRCVMLGYFNMPEKTAEVIKDGWFYTGDIGRFDDAGYLFITDRKKDLIKTSQGKYVAPQGVEAALKQSRFITEASVFGDGRKYVAGLLVPNFIALSKWAEESGAPAASQAELIARPQVRALIEAEIAAAQKDLAPHEQIKKFALLDHDLTLTDGELTPTMKVKRKAVGEKYKALIEPLFEE